MSAMLTQTTGVANPPSFKTCISFTANTSRFKFSWWARSRRIWVVSEPWSSTHEPKDRRLPNSPTAKCSKEHCQSLVPSMEIPTTTWFPCVTGGGFLPHKLQLLLQIHPRPNQITTAGCIHVCKTKSMGWGAPKVFRTDTIFDQGHYQVDVDRLYSSRRTHCPSFLDSHNTAMAFNSKSS